MTILLILFLVCLIVLAWFWDCRPAVRGAEPDPLAPTPRPLDGRHSLDHHTEHGFLKRLIVHDASEASRQLQNGLVQAERDERCLRRAMILMAGLFVLSLTGLGYCAILLPDIFRNPGHLVMRGLGYLGLGSLISQGVFLGYLLWHRIAVSRLRRECRRRVLARAQSQLKPSAAPDLTGDEAQSPGGFPIPCA
jgi:preprotein translocase subunit SecG